MATKIESQIHSADRGFGDPGRKQLRSDSASVIVPALVQCPSSEFVANLNASHFRLSDNGIEQKVFVEPALNQPLAIVVLVQNGGAASSQLPNYGKLDSILESVLGSSARAIALVTFDSRPKEIWDFPPKVDGLYYSLTHQEGGDHGAAILDAVQWRDGSSPTATCEPSSHHLGTQPVAGRRKHRPRR